MTDILYQEECYAIVGAAMEVYREMGSGFLEAVYQEALELELEARGIPFSAQPALAISYKGQPLKKEYVPDLVCFEKVLLELKALDRLSGTEEAQILNYLKASGFRLGLLINFGSPRTLEWKRFIK